MSQVWGQMPDGRDVQRLSLRGGGMTAHVLTYGAVLQDLRLDEHEDPLVLGFSEFSPYLGHSPYFGATVGRFANRIHGGHLELEGKTYQLDTNFVGKHMLHGGAASMDKLLWVVQDSSDNHVTLTLTLADGHMGFPGNLKTSVRFSLLDHGVLDIRMRAQTDATTLCSLAHHSYFKLDGSATISDHTLEIAAETYLPVDDEMIPTGEIPSLANTRFDFRRPAAVSQAHPVDHNFCLSRSRVEMRPVAKLSSAISGVCMQCHTTEAGLQIYDGAGLNIDLPGLDGAAMGPFGGLAMEPQVWPDAAHHAHFPQAILRAGEVYDQHTQFVFSK